MLKFERRSVQKIPVECWLGRRLRAPGHLFQQPGSAVERITHYRIAKRRQVNAYLVRASGIDLDFEQRELSPTRIHPLPYLVMAHRLAPLGAPRGHAGATYS